MNNSLDLFVSAFLRQKWCSISSIPIIPLMFHFNSMESWMFIPRKPVGSFTTKRQGPNFHHVTPPWAWIRKSHLSCRWLGKRCLQRYGWCDMAEEMVAIFQAMLTNEACRKILNQVEFAKYIRDDFPSPSLEKEIDLPMFILGTFAASLCNINHPRHVPAKFTTSNLKIPQRDAWPTYWNYTLLGRY